MKNAQYSYLIHKELNNLLSKSMLLVLCVISSITFYGCESDKISETQSNGPEPWLRKFYGGRHSINGTPFFTYEIQGSTNINFDSAICKSDLPITTFQRAVVKIYIPKHPTPGYQSGISTLETDRVRISYADGQLTDDLLVNGSTVFIGVIEDTNDPSLELSGFQFEMDIPSSLNIDRDNFEYIDFPFFLSYLDPDGNEIYRELRYFSILNENC